MGRRISVLHDAPGCRPLRDNGSYTLYIWSMEWMEYDIYIYMESGKDAPTLYIITY